MTVFSLRCGVQHYAWGSPNLMADHFGWPATGEPMAELWVGDHPLLPSSVHVDGHWLPLPEVIGSDPLGWLGAAVVADYGARLPMLLKILGIGEPLSLQAHPSTAQAEALAAEQAQLEAVISAAGDDDGRALDIAADALRLPEWDMISAQVAIHLRLRR